MMGLCRSFSCVANHISAYPHSAHAGEQHNKATIKGKPSRAEQKGGGEHRAEEQKHGEAKGDIENLNHKYIPFAAYLVRGKRPANARRPKAFR
jgi:hypothetical protein